MLKNTSTTRLLLFISSITIISLIIWNTFSFFKILKENELTKMEIWATAQKDIKKSDQLKLSFSETSLEVLETNNTTPMISYSPKEETYIHRNIPENKINTPKKRDRLIEQFTEEYEPIKVFYNNELLQTIYFGNSPLINKIKFYPVLLIFIMLLFFFAIYFFFRTAKASEQNKLWAGMAKETAHQIGTPLSSLVGWAEILKSENVNPDYIHEIEKDIERLKIITDRFSKVGSVPTMEKTDVVKETKASFDYIQRRSSKLINFSLDIPETPLMVNLNPQLYSWTIENIVKNGIDAMKGKGDIEISITTNLKSAFIRISDTGKGIPKKDFNKIFSPGFTSKRRGWGLGLSLAKRIIEGYHKGRIRVLKSNPSEGTTMEIILYLQND
ncbi:HAMP domain-containing histidine kinase [Flavobacteriaceae bacterium]|jgi:two-component system, sporulation sensor kinase D|nr:HAMP domain-containing histidine kinase [Flavobacteriaceae bacterium]MDA9025548.1 HAMP domain-containing histidine kinase [bacterium]MDB9913793.1 HAMP domain-containing histidine kinase [Flavobacteriaceae bacterium]MDB9989532.1 HAMP domain-containing histidine kinase [Flavobacteriaceae bacterium]MDB9993097.1 HAMP domain-containing histidine kinase [Flavobacteriaceae bacterium]